MFTATAMKVVQRLGIGLLTAIPLAPVARAEPEVEGSSETPFRRVARLTVRCPKETCVHSVSFSGNGAYLLAGCGGYEATPVGHDGVRLTPIDANVRLWDLRDLRTGQEILCLKGHTDWVTAVAFSPDGKHALSGSLDGTVRIWDLSTAKEARSLRGHKSPVWTVVWSADGRRILSGSGGVAHALTSNETADCTVRLWEASTGKEVVRCVGHSQEVRGVAFSPDGRQILTGAMDLTVRLWNAKTGKQQRLFDPHNGKRPYPGADIYSHSAPVLGVALTPDGRRALSCGGDSSLRSWDVKSGKLLRASWCGVGDTLAISPDGQWAVSTRSTVVEVWHLSSGKKVQSCPTPGSTLCVAFSADGQTLLAAGGEVAAEALWVCKWQLVKAGQGR